MRHTKLRWLYSACELFRPSDRRLSAKLVPTFADKECCVVSRTDPFGRILGFLDRSCYFFFQVPPQLYSWGWVDPVPDPLLLRKSGSAENRTRDLWICSQESSDPKTTEAAKALYKRIQTQKSKSVTFVSGRVANVNRWLSMSVLCPALDKLAVCRAQVVRHATESITLISSTGVVKVRSPSWGWRGDHLSY
jgi:hypothetical protein